MSDKYFTSQALNKLMILFIIKKSNQQFTNLELAGLFLNNRLLNYFVFQNCISELTDDGLITETIESDATFFKLTEKGEEMLPYIINTIPAGLQTLMISILSTAGKAKKDSASCYADYYLDGVNNYTVQCKFSGDNFTIMDLKVSASTEKFSKEICKNWTKYTNEIYMEIMESLLKERE